MPLNREKQSVRYQLLITGFIALCILLTSACGYQFSSSGEHIDKNLQTVFVDTFTNATSEANIENSVRNAFIDQFIRGKRFKITNSKETADVLLAGRINNLTTAPLSYKKDNLAAEERMTISMELILEEKSNRKILWTDKSFSSTQDYVFTDLNNREQNRKNALIKLSNDSAEKAYRLMMSDF